MGNQISFRPADATGKIVYWDGSVQEFHNPVTVAELMLEHPQQVVVEFHSAMNQRRPAALPADEKLEMRKIYLMLPVKRGKPIGLNSEESRHILLILNSALRSNKSLVCYSGFLPWLARNICHANTIEEGVVLQKKEETLEEKTEERHVLSEFLPEIFEGRPEFLSRQLSGKGWKPSLDTITEKKIERRISHWLFLKNFQCNHFSYGQM